ncbi:hypothetical protein [Microcoleus sp. B3-D7]|uniref:hypothetical protein n=1 Tax=Microcoleus sp. B3-D7 TaxID=2818659 RepID=UPI002FD56E6B
MFEVFSKSVKDEDIVARRHANETRGDSVRPAVQAGEGKSSSGWLAALTSRNQPPGRQTRP